MLAYASEVGVLGSRRGRRFNGHMTSETQHVKAKYLGCPEAAEKLDISEEWLRQLCARGDVPATRLHPRGRWRIPARVVADVLNDNGPNERGHQND